MKRVQSNQKPNFRSGWSNTLFLLALLGAGLLLVPSRIEAQTQWTKNALNPILSGGASGTWNRHVFSPHVIFNADSARYEMWFTASAGPGAGSWYPYSIGFAVSNDGINWTMLDTAVLSPDPGTWDESTVSAPTIIRENGQYKMWYTGFSSLDPAWGIGYATSTDGISWAKHPGNPVMEPGTAAWEAGGVANPVMLIDSGYKMWYDGWDEEQNTSRIGYATSVDGIAWQKDTLNNPVLTTGAAGQWDDNNLLVPQVLLINNIYYLWYTGNRSSDDPRQVGLATSPDGIQWTKYNDPSTTSTLYADSDPVLKPSPGEWDGNYAHPGSVLFVGGTLHMWYVGSRSPTSTYLWRIGHATSPFTPVAIEDYDNPTIPEEYLLSQNYPNPFNPVSTIRYDLPQATEVSLVVFDILGREVAMLVDDYMEPGYHRVQWNGQGFASGIYIARLATPGYSKSIKMLLLK